MLGGKATEVTQPNADLDSEFRERYRQFLTTRDISDKLYRRLVEHDLARAALIASLPPGSASLKAWLAREEQQGQLKRAFNSETYAWLVRQMGTVRGKD
jgi:hypothetical protein